MQRRGRRRARFGYYLRSIATLLTGFHDPTRIVRIFSPLPPAGTTTVSLRQSQARFTVRGATDVWSVKETWLDRFYERYGFTIEPGWTVVDIGAGIGEFTLLAASAGARAVAFEPSPASFSLLRRNLEANGAGNVVATHAAVTGRTGTTRIAVEGDPLTARAGEGSGVQVRALSLQDALAEVSMRAVDMLKIDCEGAEYDILMAATPALFARVRRIVMEVHDLDDDHTMSHIVRHLEGAGYRVETFPNPVHTWTGYLRAEHDRQDDTERPVGLMTAQQRSFT